MPDRQLPSGATARRDYLRDLEDRIHRLELAERGVGTVGKAAKAALAAVDSAVTLDDVKAAVRAFMAAVGG